jgi:outer membrane protein TolC
MKTPVLLFALLFPVIALQSQQRLELSLREAQSYAMENNREIRSARIDVDLADKKVKETTAIGLPQINASGSFQHFLDIPVTVLPDFISPTVLATLVETELLSADEATLGETRYVNAQFGTTYNASGGVAVNQLVFDGSYIVGLQAAKAYKGFAELSREEKEAEIRYSVSEAYITAIIASENLRILSGSRESVEKLLSDTRALVSNGFAEEIDADRLQLQLNGIDNQIRFAKNQEDLAQELLRFILGAPGNTEIILTDNAASVLNVSETAALETATLEINSLPRYKTINAAVGLQELVVKREKSAYLPQLNAFFSHQQNALRNEFNFFAQGGEWFPSTVWGLSLNIPLFSSGMKHYRVQQAALELEKAQLGKETVAEAANLEYNAARTELLNAVEQEQTSEENLALSKKIFSQTGIKYREGLAGSFELSQAQSQFISSEAEYIAALTYLLRSKLRLQKAINQF